MVTRSKSNHNNHVQMSPHTPTYQHKNTKEISTPSFFHLYKSEDEDEGEDEYEYEDEDEEECDSQQLQHDDANDEEQEGEGEKEKETKRLDELLSEQKEYEFCQALAIEERKSWAGTIESTPPPRKMARTKNNKNNKSNKNKINSKVIIPLFPLPQEALSYLHKAANKIAPQIACCPQYKTKTNIHSSSDSSSDSDIDIDIDVDVDNSSINSVPISISSGQQQQQQNSNDLQALQLIDDAFSEINKLCDNLKRSSAVMRTIVVESRYGQTRSPTHSNCNSNKNVHTNRPTNNTTNKEPLSNTVDDCLGIIVNLTKSFKASTSNLAVKTVSRLKKNHIDVFKTTHKNQKKEDEIRQDEQQQQQQLQALTFDSIHEKIKDIIDNNSIASCKNVNHNNNITSKKSSNKKKKRKKRKTIRVKLNESDDDDDDDDNNTVENEYKCKKNKKSNKKLIELFENEYKNQIDNKSFPTLANCKVDFDGYDFKGLRNQHSSSPNSTDYCSSSLHQAIRMFSKGPFQTADPNVLSKLQHVGCLQETQRKEYSQKKNKKSCSPLDKEQSNKHKSDNTLPVNLTDQMDAVTTDDGGIDVDNDAMQIETKNCKMKYEIVQKDEEEDHITIEEEEEEEERNENENHISVLQHGDDDSSVQIEEEIQVEEEQEGVDIDIDDGHQQKDSIRSEVQTEEEDITIPQRLLSPVSIPIPIQTKTPTQASIPVPDPELQLDTSQPQLVAEEIDESELMQDDLQDENVQEQEQERMEIEMDVDDINNSNSNNKNNIRRPSISSSVQRTSINSPLLHIPRTTITTTTNTTAPSHGRSRSRPRSRIRSRLRRISTATTPSPSFNSNQQKQQSTRHSSLHNNSNGVDIDVDVDVDVDNDPVPSSPLVNGINIPPPSSFQPLSTSLSRQSFLPSRYISTPNNNNININNISNSTPRRRPRTSPSGHHSIASPPSTTPRRMINFNESHRNRTRSISPVAFPRNSRSSSLYNSSSRPTTTASAFGSLLDNDSGSLGVDVRRDNVSSRYASLNNNILNQHIRNRSNVRRPRSRSASPSVLFTDRLRYENNIDVDDDNGNGNGNGNSNHNNTNNSKSENHNVDDDDDDIEFNPIPSYNLSSRSRDFHQPSSSRNYGGGQALDTNTSNTNNNNNRNSNSNNENNDTNNLDSLTVPSLPRLPFASTGDHQPTPPIPLSPPAPPVRSASLTYEDYALPSRRESRRRKQHQASQSLSTSTLRRGSLRPSPNRRYPSFSHLAGRSDDFSYPSRRDSSRTSRRLSTLSSQYRSLYPPIPSMDTTPILELDD